MRARAAAAGFPSQTISEEQFKEMQEQSVRGFCCKFQAPRPVQCLVLWAC